jgi:hypothetical protein
MALWTYLLLVQISRAYKNFQPIFFCFYDGAAGKKIVSSNKKKGRATKIFQRLGKKMPV